MLSLNKRKHIEMTQHPWWFICTCVHFCCSRVCLLHSVGTEL